MAIPTNFPRFNRLPQELQLLIWETAIRAIEDRVIEVFFKQVMIKGEEFFDCRTRAKTPSILNTCATSRRVGLKIWRRIIITSIVSGVYINWEKDTLLLTIDRQTGSNLLYKVLSIIAQPPRSNIATSCRRLAVDFWMLCQYEQYTGLWTKGQGPLDAFCKLEALVRIIPRPHKRGEQLDEDCYRRHRKGASSLMQPPYPFSSGPRESGKRWMVYSATLNREV